MTSYDDVSHDVDLGDERILSVAFGATSSQRNRLKIGDGRAGDAYDTSRVVRTSSVRRTYSVRHSSVSPVLNVLRSPDVCLSPLSSVPGQHPRPFSLSLCTSTVRQSSLSSERRASTADDVTSGAAELYVDDAVEDKVDGEVDEEQAVNDDRRRLVGVVHRT